MKVIGKKRSEQSIGVIFLSSYHPLSIYHIMMSFTFLYFLSTVRALDAKMPFSGEQFRLIEVCSAFMLLKLAGVHYGEGEQGAAGDAFI